LMLFFIGFSCTNGIAKDSMDSMDSMESMDTGDVMSPQTDQGDVMMIADDDNFFSTKGLQPRVVPFTTEAAAAELAAKGPTVYFFAATWCPKCQAMMRNLEQNVSKIPQDVTLVLVNYDTNKALNQKYGVTYQHTYVQIDETGKKIAIWAGSGTVEDLLKRIVRSGT
jgi:thiol-disulfide isomerase/thioredoxin